MFPKIQNGAIFIADAHENDRRDNFYHFLKLIESKEITTPQLFLMGDMFDLLVGKVEYSVKKYQNYIDLIDSIALHVEVYYFEGNHDFAIANLFKNLKVVPIQLQPMQFVLEDKTLVYLSHGDKYGGFVHNTYTKIIRASSLLKILNFIDKKIDNYIAKKIENEQFKKKICSTIENFEEIISSKIPNYNAKQNSYIVEGHYHQNYSFTQNGVNYINLPSFACNQSYFIVECSQKEKFALRGCNV
jgi:UDP-2,3-diacylglucosamine hydrolase